MNPFCLDLFYNKGGELFLVPLRSPPRKIIGSNVAVLDDRGVGETPEGTGVS